MSAPEFVAEHVKRLRVIEKCKALPVVMRVDAHLKLKIELQGTGSARKQTVEVITAQVAKALGVSEKPVREALGTLVAQGLLELVEQMAGIERKRIYQLPLLGAGAGGIARMREEGGSAMPSRKRKEPTAAEVDARIKSAVLESAAIRREHAKRDDKQEEVMAA